MRVYFAGFETCFSYGFKPLPKLNYFATYYYKNNTNKVLKSHGKDIQEGLIVVDSGAHSFFSFIGLSVSADNRLSTTEMPDPDLYFENYLNWIKEYYNYFDYFVELDIQDIVGMDKVRQWRKRLIDANVFDKCILVHHSCNSWQDYEEILSIAQSKYIALEGLRNGKINLPYLKCIKAAYDKKIRVHGFALTAPKVCLNYPFYSVDSTTWTAVNRYGRVQLFIDGKIKAIETSKENYIKYRLPTCFANFNKTKEHQHAKLAFEVEQFLKYQDYLTKYWIGKGINWEEQLK